MSNSSQPIFYSSTRSNLVTSSSPHDPILIDDEQGERAIVDQEDLDDPKNEGNDEPTPKQGSLTTIFSIWNTMMGSSLLTIPWGFSQSGTLGGVITMIVIGIVCYYTCYLIVKHGTGYDDFFDLCNDYLGRWGQLLCWGSSLLVLLGALMAYDGLMSDCLFSAVNGIRDYITDSNHDEERFWNKKLSPLIIFITMFPITNFKELTLFVKLNSYGLIAVCYILVFIIYTSVGVQGISSDLPPVFESHFPKFGGILTLSFFIHNCILPILKNAREPQHNTRNMGIAFILVGISYATIGFIAYIAYHNYAKAIPEDFLTIFSDTNIPAIIARICLLLQLFTVFPLIVYIMRCQFFGLLYGNTYPSMSRVVIHNLVVCILCTLVSIFYPHVGDILRFTGASCGLIYVFILPIGVHMMKTYPSSIPSIIDGDVENTSSPYMSLPPQDHSLVHVAHDSPNHVQHTELIPDKVYERHGWMFWSSVVGHTALILFGTASLVGQFI